MPRLLVLSNIHELLVSAFVLCKMTGVELSKLVALQLVVIIVAVFHVKGNLFAANVRLVKLERLVGREASLIDVPNAEFLLVVSNFEVYFWKIWT